MYDTYSEIENAVSDRMFVYSIDNKMKYPSAFCTTPDKACELNKEAINSMKNGEILFLRQLSLSTIALYIQGLMPNVPKSEILDRYKSKYGGDFPSIQEVDFPTIENLSVDFASVYKYKGKYYFKVLEANGPRHSTHNACVEQMTNDAVKEATLEAVGIKKKHVASGILECSDKETFISETISWLADHE